MTSAAWRGGSISLPQRRLRGLQLWLAIVWQQAAREEQQQEREAQQEKKEEERPCKEEEER